MRIFLSIFFLVTNFSIIAMGEYIANEFDQEQSEAIIQRLGGKKRCEKILAQWNEYEKRLLVTVLKESKWPSHRVGGPLYFAKQKEIYPKHFLAYIDNQQVKVLLDDFKVVAELHNVPLLDTYEDEMRKFNYFREHFDTEDETWLQMDRQLNIGK